MALNDTGVYEQMKAIFNQGKLVDDEMSKCHMLVENGASTIFGEKVNMSCPIERC
jgi:hypothetical protein